MIYKITGTIDLVKPGWIIIKAGGIGYGIYIPLEWSEKITLGEMIEVAVRLIRRETHDELYGFENQQSAMLFDFLRNLNGIGPRLALNIISTLGIEKTILLIRSEESNELTKVPKIGKQKAEKIIFESKANSKKFNQIAIYNQDEDKITEDKMEQAIFEALLNMGFQKSEIQKAKAKINSKELPQKSEKTLSTWVRAYLNQL